MSNTDDDSNNAVAVAATGTAASFAGNTSTTVEAAGEAQDNNHDSKDYNDYYYLDSESVILITGAAGFLGSELAMALHRTYQPKTIICVDSLDTNRGFGLRSRKRASSSSSASSSSQQKHQTEQTEEHQQQPYQQDLALLEFKRQRLFHLMQTLRSNGVFYKVDFRPSIPEYYDAGEVPILAHIFQQHPDITHVVHLADHYHHGTVAGASSSRRSSEEEDEEEWDNDLAAPLQQAIPRVRGQPKAGMMEALLEQLSASYYYNNHTAGRQWPQFVYASSYQVYNYRFNNTTPRGSDQQRQQHSPPPYAEDMPLTVPSTLAGAQKMMDELMALAYYDTHGIFSLGLRFFPVYGPWGLPGSPIFEMAERIIAGDRPFPPAHDLYVEEEGRDEAGADSSSSHSSYLDDVRDFVYIDDAVDAMLSAMQFRPLVDDADDSHGGMGQKQPRPIVINVGTGQGTTLRAIAKHMQSYFPQIQPSVDGANRMPRTVCYASTIRAEQLLGFRPRVSLEQGMEQLLAWHYDRAFPYGGKPVLPSQDGNAVTTDIAERGMVSCSPFDLECLRGTPVFPCASECAHELQCTTSLWNDVLEYTRALTSGCRVVLYTVSLDDHLTVIPSTVVRVSEKSIPRVQDRNNKNCNVAFVSESSELYRTSKKAYSRHSVVRHEFWVLVPVVVTDYTRTHRNILEIMPKLSPGLFFGSATKYAIYSDPNVIFHSIPKLLHEVSMQPYHGEMEGKTALLIGKRSDGAASMSSMSSRWNVTPADDIVQDHAYRMIRIALIDEMKGDGFAQLVDSSFLVHALKHEDARLFRCDVYGEVIQWNSSSDRSSFEFIMGLHDMWSRVIARNTGHNPWWIGDGVETVDEAGKQQRRRHPSDAGGSSPKSSSSSSSTRMDPRRRLQQKFDGVDGAGDDQNEEEDEEEDRGAAAADAGKEVEEEEDRLSPNLGDGHDHNGFGGRQQPVADQQGLHGSNNRQPPQERHEKPPRDGDDDYEADDDQIKVGIAPHRKQPQRTQEKDEEGPGGTKTGAGLDASDPQEEDEQQQQQLLPVMPKPPRDPSSYDVWMGILSSTPTIQSFARIVTMEAVGAVHVDDFFDG